MLSPFTLSALVHAKKMYDEDGAEERAETGEGGARQVQLEKADRFDFALLL